MRATVLFLMMVACLSMHGKYHNDQYVRLKLSCTNRCEPKGYFQDLCIKICLSPICYQEVYLGKENTEGPVFELGLADTDETKFRRCWLDNFAKS